jgi:hypothetical protein
MPWKRMLAYITGSVNEDLLRRIEYLLEENRVLRNQTDKHILLDELFDHKGFHRDGFQLGAIRLEGLQNRRQLGGQTPTVDRLALLVDEATVHIAFVQIQACV